MDLWLVWQAVRVKRQRDVLRFLPGEKFRAKHFIRVRLARRRPNLKAPRQILEGTSGSNLIETVRYKRNKEAVF